jgi:hypothetical protein
MTDLNRVKHLAGLTIEMDSARGLLKEYGDMEPAGDNEDYRDGHDINLLKAVAKQMAEDAQNNDYTAIDDLLKNVSTEEIQGFLSEMESIE